MKNKCLVLALMVFVVIFVACSDDTDDSFKSAVKGIVPNSDVVIDRDTIVGGITVVEIIDEPQIIEQFPVIDRDTIVGGITVVEIIDEPQIIEQFPVIDSTEIYRQKKEKKK